MTDEKRNLVADLAICEAATPGPWRAYYAERDCDWECGHRATDPPCKVSDCGYLRQWEPADVSGPFVIECDGFNGLSNENAAFIAAAREGWPHAIRRALAAEARVAELEAEVARLRQYVRDSVEYRRLRQLHCVEDCDECDVRERCDELSRAISLVAHEIVGDDEP